MPAVSKIAQEPPLEIPSLVKKERTNAYKAGRLKKYH